MGDDLRLLLSPYKNAYRDAPSTTTPASNSGSRTATLSWAPHHSRPRNVAMASHPPLTPYDCIFHAFGRIPVWELQTNQQLLRGLLDALAGTLIQFTYARSYCAYFANAIS